MGLESFQTESGSNSTAYNKDKLKELLIQFNEDEEQKLTSTAFDKTDGYPASSTIERQFGSWNEGLQAADIEPDRLRGQFEVTDSMLEPSPEKAYIIGALLGDGTINKENCFVLPTTDKEFAEAVGEAFCEWSGLNWDGFGSDDTEVSCIVREMSNENHRDQYVIKKGVSSISEHLKSYKYPVDKEKIMNEFKGYEKELLRGLWDSEGSVSKDGRVRFVNKDKGIVDIFIDSVTVHECISESDICVYKEQNCYRLVLPYNKAREFTDYIQPSISRKIDKLNRMEDSRSSESVTFNSGLYKFKK